MLETTRAGRSVRIAGIALLSKVPSRDTMRSSGSMCVSEETWVKGVERGRVYFGKNEFKPDHFEVRSRRSLSGYQLVYD